MRALGEAITAERLASRIGPRCPRAKGDLPVGCPAGEVHMRSVRGLARFRFALKGEGGNDR
jgi:hypothetical protein